VVVVRLLEWNAGGVVRGWEGMAEELRGTGTSGFQIKCHVARKRELLMDHQVE
jgi:hypothetical protein